MTTLAIITGIIAIGAVAIDLIRAVRPTTSPKENRRG